MDTDRTTPVIHGHTQLTVSDDLIITARLLLRFQIAFLVLLAALGFGLFIAIGQDEFFEFGAAVWPAILFPIVVILFVFHLASAVHFWRRPKSDRVVDYVVDAQKMTISDGTGTVLVVPWALVRHAETRFGFVFLKLRSRAWRVFPLRAFSADDAEILTRWAINAAAATGTAPVAAKGKENAS